MESVAIAPLWASAHAVPEGEGFAGQHGKQGYMLFLNVLMRPALMVSGLFMAMFMIKGVSWLVGRGLELYFKTTTAGEFVGPLSAIAMTVVGLSVIIRLTHKCFDLIEWMPDNAMKWLGGGSSLGTSQDENRMSGMVMGAVRSIGGMNFGSTGANPMLAELQAIGNALGVKRGGGEGGGGGGVDQKRNNELAPGNVPAPTRSDDHASGSQGGPSGQGVASGQGGAGNKSAPVVSHAVGDAKSRSKEINDK